MKRMLIIIAAAVAVCACMPAFAADEKKDKKPEWYETIKFKGDFRFRQQYEETVKDSGDPTNESTSHRVRERIRARFGFEAAIKKDWKFYAGLCSGGDDPTSTNQTFDEAFSSKGLMLDFAFLKWMPLHAGKGKDKKPEGGELVIFAGKMKNPFYKPDKSQLILDGDVTPEGWCLVWKNHMSRGAVTPFALFGQFWLNEIKSDYQDPKLDVFQFGSLFKFGKKHELAVGVGYFGFNDLEGEDLLNDGGSAKSHGNTVDGSDKYMNSYYLTNVFAEFKTKFGSTKFNAYLDFVRNADPEEFNTGMIFGFGLGFKCGFSFKWYYRKVEADAVIGGLTDSDFAGQNTSAQGQYVSLGYKLASGASLGLTYFMAEQDLEDAYRNDYNLLQLDLKLKF